jgi:hypothetical protein
MEAPFGEDTPLRRRGFVVAAGVEWAASRTLAASTILLKRRDLDWLQY